MIFLAEYSAFDDFLTTLPVKKILLGVSVPIYERYDDAKKQAMATLSSKKHAVFHECSVASCLNQFTAPELLTGNNKFGCVKCAAKKYGKQNKGALFIYKIYHIHCVMHLYLCIFFWL